MYSMVDLWNIYSRGLAIEFRFGRRTIFVLLREKFPSKRSRRLSTVVDENNHLSLISRLLENDPGQITNFNSPSLGTVFFVYQCSICGKILQKTVSFVQSRCTLAWKSSKWPVTALKHKKTYQYSHYYSSIAFFWKGPWEIIANW